MWYNAMWYKKKPTIVWFDNGIDSQMNLNTKYSDDFIHENWVAKGPKHIWYDKSVVLSTKEYVIEIKSIDRILS